ncbi:MAG: hypothetical protein AAGG68_25725 [Bacteroidota bacterium]
MFDALQIETIQASTNASATAIAQISERVGGLKSVMDAVLIAVEQQGGSTREISSKISDVSNANRQVASDLGALRGASSQVEESSGVVRTAAQTLAGRAEKLKSEIASFVLGMRTAS